MGDPENTTTGGSKWVRTMPTTSDGRFTPVHDGAVQYHPIPADGDDYTYKPPLIPAQWVPVTEYRHLVAAVAQQERRIVALEALLERQDETQGTPGGTTAYSRNG